MGYYDYPGRDDFVSDYEHMDEMGGIQQGATEEMVTGQLGLDPATTEAARLGESKQGTGIMGGQYGVRHGMLTGAYEEQEGQQFGGASPGGGAGGSYRARRPGAASTNIFASLAGNLAMRGISSGQQRLVKSGIEYNQQNQALFTGGELGGARGGSSPQYLSSGRGGAAAPFGSGNWMAPGDSGGVNTPLSFSGETRFAADGSTTQSGQAGYQGEGVSPASIAVGAAVGTGTQLATDQLMKTAGISKEYRQPISGMAGSTAGGAAGGYTAGGAAGAGAGFTAGGMAGVAAITIPKLIDKWTHGRQTKSEEGEQSFYYNWNNINDPTNKWGGDPDAWAKDRWSSYDPDAEGFDKATPGGKFGATPWDAWAATHYRSGATPEEIFGASYMAMADEEEYEARPWATPEFTGAMEEVYGKPDFNAFASAHPQSQQFAGNDRFTNQMQTDWYYGQNRRTAPGVPSGVDDPYGSYHTVYGGGLKEGPAPAPTYNDYGNQNFNYGGGEFDVPYNDDWDNAG